MASTGRDIAVGYRRVRAICHDRLDLIAHLAKDRFFAFEVGLEREGRRDLTGARF